ncbi:hypothetical protein [Actinomadura sp. 21ATH]|uniref:hypothetical protein n=1 Tax=Actinomadura sp. 21ATH TaxID=1735444 RepID=UPI0035C05D85
MTALRTINGLLVAPGAGTGELAVTYGAAAAGTVLAAALALDAGYAALPAAVIAAVAFDMFGGAVANATGAAKRRFHGPGEAPSRRLGFVAVHVQPFLVALAVPGYGWAAAGLLYALAVAGALAATAAPADLRPPVAFGAAVLGTAVALTAFPVPGALLWLAPALLVKLLLAHFLPA